MFCKGRKAAQRAAIEESHMNQRYVHLHRPPSLLQGPFPSLVVAARLWAKASEHMDYGWGSAEVGLAARRPTSPLSAPAEAEERALMRVTHSRSPL